MCTMGLTNQRNCCESQTDEARKYLDGLLWDGVRHPVDEDVHSYDMRLPEWYDEEKFKRAQLFFKANIFAMMTGKLLGLLAVLAVPSTLKILIHTKESGTPMSAYRRYLTTILHTFSWYHEELVEGSRSWKSLEAVRKRHVRVSLQTAKSKVGIISQKDMAVTQFGFVGFILLKPHYLGVQVSRDNFEALTHFWRVIGHMLGIEDEFNLMTDSWATTRPRLEIVCNEVLRPILNSTTSDFHVMSEALLTGMWCFMPFIRTDSFLYYVKMVCGCPDYIYLENDLAMLDSQPERVDRLRLMGWYSRVLLFLQYIVHVYLLNFFWVRWFMNSMINLAWFIIEWFPYLAIFQYGVRKAYVRILGEPYKVWGLEK